MVPPPPSSHSYSRSGTFSPASSLSQNYSLQTGGFNHSPHPYQTGPLSAGASPNASSPTAGNSSLIKIVVAQVYLLLTTLKDDKDRAKWELQAEQLTKLVNDHGMEVFTKYFTRLVTQNASTIFPAQNRPVSSPSNYNLLAAEISKISKDHEQAAKVAESIETGSEDLFRDFDLSTFMEHFKLDALEKTIFALAFKFGSRQDLKTKADAILSANFHGFVSLLSRPGAHADLSPNFIAEIVDRYIQGHPPNFQAAAKMELAHNVKLRWSQPDQAPPMEVLAALDLGRVLADKPSNALALYILRTGSEFTCDEDVCVRHLQNRPANVQLSAEQVSSALTYTTISLTPRHDPSVLVAALRQVLLPNFKWQDVLSGFDQRDVRVSSDQFLRLYRALLPIAEAQSASSLDGETLDGETPHFEIQHLWGGSHWENPETQLSFICAYASLTPDELDASTIPGLEPNFTLDDYIQSPDEARDRAAHAVRHPLVSQVALTAIFHVALHSLHASQSTEAKRLFQQVVVPNLDIFIVSAFGAEKPWPQMAVDTLISLFDQFLHKRTAHDVFVLDSLWRKDKDWVTQRLIDAHAAKPLDLNLIFDHVIKHKWLDDLVYLPNGFGLDLAALAHAEGYLSLLEWASVNGERGVNISQPLAQFLLIKANMELSYQRNPEDQLSTTTLQVKTVAAMLQILEDLMPKKPVQELILIQRNCVISYPRLINYGEGYDDIIEANCSAHGNALPVQANIRMEEHYKTMYGNETQVKEIVEILARYKHSREPLDQDVFACMIHGLFDEYSHYQDYPLEALATTAVLFGGIISHKLVNDLPLKIGLGMILEAVKEHSPDEAMYKFGLQALMQLFPRFREWPGFCVELTSVPALQGTEAFNKASDVVHDHDGDPDAGDSGPGHAAEPLVNGERDDTRSVDTHKRPFSAIDVEGPARDDGEEPGVELQDRIQFGLNNLTQAKLQSTFRDIQEMLDERHQQWFANHLVEERAKMQPNYHQVYLDLVKLFQDKNLNKEVMRQTYISIRRMLNAESTMQNSTERTHLKHLGLWLGLLTIARDQPIKQRNIAFKQLLLEAYDSQRLIMVIPFICKVLVQGAHSTVYRPPNPWLMDILHLLIEMYNDAELKLNLKFEIEVLCKELDLDHKSIEPSCELAKHLRQTRLALDEGVEIVGDGAEPFEGGIALNGIGSSTNAQHSIPVAIPDFSSMLQFPPTSEMVVGATRLHEIVRTAVRRALEDIIQPVVDRSVTIAAISTCQMIHKDFATEADEHRLRNSAITMVKATAGSLALVTSKEPLRTNITNYMRSLATELPSGLPEGTIIMCVNLNLDLACNIIEKSAQDRAVPEIEELLEPELEIRRRHRQQRPNEPYLDPNLSRWAMTIPNPYKLSPNVNGLTAEQMAIYEDFARQPRGASGSTPAHGPSGSDAARNITNEVLQDQYSSVPSLPTPGETPSLPPLQTQLPYHVHQGISNGRASAHPTQIDARALTERVEKCLAELHQRAAAETQVEHLNELPRPHQVLEAVDALTQLIIRTYQSSEGCTSYLAEKLCFHLFTQTEHTLFTESLVRVLALLLKITSGSELNGRVRAIVHSQTAQSFLNLPLIAALLQTAPELLDLQVIDSALAKMLIVRKDGSLEFFEHLMDLMLFGERTVALYSDFLQSLQAAWTWISNDGEHEIAVRLKAKIRGNGFRSQFVIHPQDRKDHFEYLFDEWNRLLTRMAPEKAFAVFVQQLRSRAAIRCKDDYMEFLRVALDMSVVNYDHTMVTSGNIADALTAVDALVKLVAVLARDNLVDRPGPDGAIAVIDMSVNVATLVLNHYHMGRGEHFPQRVFFRFFSMLIHRVDEVFGTVRLGASEEAEKQRAECLLKMADAFMQLAPGRFPGFAYGWLGLINHIKFLPPLMALENKRGWEPMVNLLSLLLKYLGEHVKSADVSDPAKDFMRCGVKFLLVIQHDFGQFVVGNHARLCAAVPPHATQLRNIILHAGPRPDATDGEEFVEGEGIAAAAYLRDHGLLELVDELVQTGPSEDAIAHLKHAMSKAETVGTVFGNVAINSNTDLITSVVLYIGEVAVKRAQQPSTPVLFMPGAPDVATLSMLVHELAPEPRYFMLSSLIDELRYPSSDYTKYFSSLLLEIWGYDVADPEEADVRQQLVRIIMERFSGYWPQPWGLMFLVIELTKSDKYMFFDQPFIKADREVADRFNAMFRSINEQERNQLFIP